MALGLSKDDTETKFDASDAIIAGVDVEGKGFVTDYFFESNEVVCFKLSFSFLDTFNMTFFFFFTFFMRSHIP